MKDEPAEKPANMGNGIDPVHLAMLAALLDPASCKSGNGEARSALFHAIALCQQSQHLCAELDLLTIDEMLGRLAQESHRGNKGAERLHDVILWRHYQPPPDPTLTLAIRDTDADTLRPYLAKKANFEGSTGKRKAWGQVRTVLENLKAFFIDWANRQNQKNAPRLRLEMAELGRTPSWEDGQEYHASNLQEWRRPKDGELTHYEIPQWAADELIKWKQYIRRRRGGLKKVRSLTVEEVIGEPRKKAPEAEAKHTSKRKRAARK